MAKGMMGRRVGSPRGQGREPVVFGVQMGGEEGGTGVGGGEEAAVERQERRVERPPGRAARGAGNLEFDEDAPDQVIQHRQIFKSGVVPDGRRHDARRAAVRDRLHPGGHEDRGPAAGGPVSTAPVVPLRRIATAW